MNNKQHTLQKYTFQLAIVRVTYPKMDVNCSASLLKISHTNFRIVCYHTHFKTLP